jgi:uncharacterized protein with HEPN domain
MSKEPIEYLKHIRDESFYILSVITPDKAKDDFLTDETLKRAVIRSLEIIGEATKHGNVKGIVVEVGDLGHLPLEEMEEVLNIWQKGNDDEPGFLKIEDKLCSMKKLM